MPLVTPSLILGLIGRIFDDKPEIRVRVGVWGYLWEIEASRILEVPEGLKDGATELEYLIGYNEDKEEIEHEDE